MKTTMQVHHHTFLNRSYMHMVNAHQSLASAISRRTGEDFNDEELEQIHATLRLILRRVGRREEEARARWQSFPRDVHEKCRNGEATWPDEPGHKLE